MFCIICNFNTKNKKEFLDHAISFKHHKECSNLLIVANQNKKNNEVLKKTIKKGK